MTAPLDEKALAEARTSFEMENSLERAIRAYLAASPSPSEMDEYPWDRFAANKTYGVFPSHAGEYVTLSQAQSSLEAMRAERIEAERDALSFAGKLKAAQAQVLRLTEENEALIRERDELVYLMGEVDQGNAIQEARIKALEEALTPSGETKAAYIGEFSFLHEQWNVEGDDTETVQITVPWTTVKEVMAAIRARALKENAL